MRDAGDDTGEELFGFGVVEGTEAEGVEDGDGPGAHCEDIAEDTSDSSGGALEGFDGAGVVVGFDFEGELESAAEVDDAGVFSGTDEDAIALGGELF